jgi:hypothetical protein
MITTEYPTVLKRSKDRTLLEKMHGIVISEASAREVVFSYLDPEEFSTDVRFTGTSGRGRCEYKSNNRRIDIMLPSDDSKRLTLGITLHEIAHAIAYLDHNAPKHDDTFVKVLDGLAFSEWTWKTEDKALVPWG